MNDVSGPVRDAGSPLLATTHAAHSTDLELRAPSAREGLAIHDLVAQCASLDANSLYCNVLQCTHFAETSAVAMRDSQLVAFASGYRVPNRPEVLFIWQIAVAEQARGQGLGKRLVRAVLERPACRDIRFVRATVTSENASSRAMFRGLARSLGARINEQKVFDSSEHFGGRHESEHELSIGPF
jgi:L-2,4-diaminobutyric acid acetyltransferase